MNRGTQHGVVRAGGTQEHKGRQVAVLAAAKIVPGDLAHGRERAAMEIIGGFQRALAALDPDDDAHREWLTRCLNAACRAAGVPPPT